MNDVIQVVTTAGSREDADKIAATLVRQRLAACAQVSGPMTSTYRWQGEIETSEEWLCTIKTRRELFGRVEQEICRVHPYDVPEILAMPVIAGSEDYLKWLAAETLSPE